MEREEILKYIQSQINVNGHIIGAVVGSGMTAKCVTQGGADILLALSAGKARIMGRSSFASYLCYGNSNDIVMELGEKELFPIIKDMPILFGLNATDPQIHIYEYLKKIKSKGFSGIVNFPTISLIDGNFREALEQEGTSYDCEVEAIKLAHLLGLFTVSFVTTEDECNKMLEAGTDVICVHLGLTKGGLLGARRYLSLHDASKLADSIFGKCKKQYPNVIRMIYAGPAITPIDLQYLYQNTDYQGYIGGSTFDRIPSEHAIINTTKAFKTQSSLDRNTPLSKLVDGTINTYDYVDFVKEYIANNYNKTIYLEELALVAHISTSYLSTLFKREVGISFKEYLINFRLNRAKSYMYDNYSCKEIAEMVGYSDYAQFSKIFKKYTGMTPKDYKNYLKL